MKNESPATSIPHVAPKVKSLNEKKEEWTMHKRESQELAEKMFSAGYKQRAYRMRDCGKVVKIMTCPGCGRSATSSTTLCRDKVCPTCQWRLSLKRYSQMCSTLGLIQDLDTYTAHFLTLTVRNCAPGKLRDTLGTMASAWNRMLQRAQIKRNLAGWARSLEITYNQESATMHPHYHCILLMPSDIEDSEGDLNIMYNRHWQSAARLGYQPITDLRAITNLSPETGNEGLRTALLETYKYSIKSKDMADMPLTDFRRLLEGIDGKRMTAYGGVIKDARRQLALTDDDTLDADERPPEACIDCGTVLIPEILEWSFGEKVYKKMSFGGGASK